MPREAFRRIRTPVARRIWRDACLVAGGVGLILLAFLVWVGFTEKNWGSLWFGGDYDYCMNLARAWLHDGSYFHANQLVSGPHDWLWGDVVYPPVALWLFVPFSFLPPELWYGIPFAVIAAAMWRLRPALWAWALIPLLLVSPEAVTELLSGNPLIWVVAILFASVAWGSPASLILFKPSLLPFGLFGLNRRAWWLGVGLVALLTLPFADLTVTWVRVLLDTHGRLNPMYNIEEFPYVAIPLVAWAGSSRFRTARLAQLLDAWTAPSQAEPDPAPGAV
jgi:hypothetical protein